MLEQKPLFNFEIQLANGKSAAFDTGAEIDEYFQRTRTVVGGIKKKKNKKKIEEDNNVGQIFSVDYKNKLKRCKPKSKHSSLIRKKPGNMQLLAKLQLI